MYLIFFLFLFRAKEFHDKYIFEHGFISRSPDNDGSFVHTQVISRKITFFFQKYNFITVFFLFKIAAKFIPRVHERASKNYEKQKLCK